MRSRKLIILVVLLLLIAMMSGCSTNTSARYDDKSFTLYVGNISDSLPTTFMPWLSNQGISTTLSSSIYSTLFSYNDEEDIYEPNLAKSWKYVVEPEEVPENQDYLAIKIELDRAATWSDGSPVTSKDVYFTFDLASDFGRTNHAGALAWIGDLLHTYTRDSKGNYSLTRQGVFTKDNPGTYEFREDEDNVIYLHVKKVLGAITPLYTTVLILPEHKWNVISPKNQLNTTDPIPSIRALYNNPIGSGPYTLDSEKSNSSIIVLNKRLDYHRKDDNGESLYKPDVIKFVNYMDINVAINALKKGDIDVINSSIDGAYIENLSKEKNLALDYSEGEFIQTLVLNLNPPENYSTPEREILRIPEVREAISLAIDQQFLIDNVLKGKGSLVSSGLVNESMPFYNSEIGVAKTDIDKAKKLLDEAGCILGNGQKIRSKDGVKLSYKISGSQGTKNLVNYIKVQLEQVGIEVNFEEGGSNAVRDRYYTGNFDMTVQGVTFEMTNVDMMLTAHFVTVGSSSNYGRLEDMELASKIEKMRTTLSYSNKVELLKEIQLDLANLHYKIPLYCSDVISVYRTDIFEGWTTSKGSTIYNSDTLFNLKLKN